MNITQNGQTIRKINPEAIRELVSAPSSPELTVVTMYIPMETTASPPHITENQIRFKNLIHKAQQELEAAGDSSKLSKELAALLEDNYDNIEFWKSQTRGLLVCAAPGSIQLFNLPVDTEEYVAVDDTYHLAPIIALLSDAREYYVLALAQQGPKLYRGDMYGVHEMQVGLPVTMREALGIDEANQQSENQGSATGSSLNTGWFNGRGGARDPQDNDRMRFFHLIDKILHDKTDRSSPLILAGIDAEIAEFREISKYPHIMHGAIQGNHTETNPEELHRRSAQIVMEELVQPAHATDREEYERLQGANPDKVAADAGSIHAAAEQGRIDKLLAQMGRNTTDTVQDRIESVFRISFGDAESSKALNKLAAKVWQMSGKVVSLLPDEMPGGAPMVARLRY